MDDLPIKRNEYAIPVCVVLCLLLGFLLGYLAFGFHNGDYIGITGTVTNIEGKNITISNGVDSVTYTSSHNFDEEYIETFLHQRIRLIVDMSDDRGSSSLERI